MYLSRSKPLTLALSDLSRRHRENGDRNGDRKMPDRKMLFIEGVSSKAGHAARHGPVVALGATAVVSEFIEARRYFRCSAGCGPGSQVEGRLHEVAPRGQTVKVHPPASIRL